MNKDAFLKGSSAANIGEIPKTVINITLDEEEIELFLEKAMEYSSFNALKQLGDDGGILKEQNCERINGYVIWKGDCLFSDKIELNFFERFSVLFDNYLKERGLGKVTAEWKIDENNKLILKTKGIVELEYEGIKYGFEPDSKYVLDYRFGDYNEILGKVNECIKKEGLKGLSRNNLFEDCRNDKDFEFGIKVEEGYVFFDVVKAYNNLGNVTVKFTLLYNQ